MECVQWDLDFGVKKKGLIFFFSLEKLKTLEISRVCENFCGMRIACQSICLP